MIATALSPACALRHRDGQTAYLASLDLVGQLVIDYGPTDRPRTCLVDHPEAWLLVRGTDADLDAIHAAGLAVGDGRQKGENP